MTHRGDEQGLGVYYLLAKAVFQTRIYKYAEKAPLREPFLLYVLDVSGINQRL